MMMIFKTTNFNDSLCVSYNNTMVRFSSVDLFIEDGISESYVREYNDNELALNSSKIKNNASELRDAYRKRGKKIDKGFYQDGRKHGEWINYYGDNRRTHTIYDCGTKVYTGTALINEEKLIYSISYNNIRFVEDVL